MVAVLGVEAGVVDEVDAAADDVARGEGGPVRLARARRAEGVSVVAVVSVRMLVPPWNTTYANITSLHCFTLRPCYISMY